MEGNSGANVSKNIPDDLERFKHADQTSKSAHPEAQGGLGSQAPQVGSAGVANLKSPPAYSAHWVDPARAKNVKVTISSQLEGCKGAQRIDSEVTTQSTGKAQPPFRFAGISASLLASVFFSLSILIVKMLPEYNGIQDYAQVLFFRGLIIMILSSISTLYTGETFLVCRQEVLVNFLRALFGTINTFGSYCALNYISAGDSTAIVFSAPIWTSILSYFILSEPLHWVHFVGLPASLFGIVLIAHPTLIVPAEYLWTFDSLLDANTTNSIRLVMNEQLNEEFHFAQRWPGVALSVLTSVALAGCFIVLKYRKRTSIQTTTFWFSAFMCLTGATLMLALGAQRFPSTLYQWQLIIANGIFAWLGQSTLQWAFTYEQAGLLSIVRTADVAITFVLSAIFLDDAIYWTSIVGAAIISAVVVSIVLNNWIITLSCFRLPRRQSQRQNNLPVFVSSADSKLTLQLANKTKAAAPN